MIMLFLDYHFKFIFTCFFFPSCRGGKILCKSVVTENMLFHLHSFLLILFFSALLRLQNI